MYGELVARLCRFYPGLNPRMILRMDGWSRTSLALMMPRLQAEETMSLANAAALGSGSMERKEHEKLWRRLVRAARGPVIREPGRIPSDPFEHAEGLMRAGLNVVIQEKLPDGTIREVDPDG